MASPLTARDGLELYLHDWSIDRPELVLAVIHGYGEHGGRYAHVAKALNQRRISVLGCDLRGHGRSAGIRGYVERFSDYHQDLDALVALARAQAAGRPVAVYGHSMGALATIDWLLARNGRDLCGVVLTSPFLGLALKVNPLKIALARAMSKLKPTLALPSELKGKDVTRDPEIAALYDSDPLNNKNATSRWFTEAMDAIDRAQTRAAELTNPLLILYGGADKVASADDTDRFVGGLTGKDRFAERLAEHYHELVNEPVPVRDRVIERIGSWLLSHAAAKAA